MFCIVFLSYYAADCPESLTVQHANLIEKGSINVYYVYVMYSEASEVVSKLQLHKERRRSYACKNL